MEGQYYKGILKNKSERTYIGFMQLSDGLLWTW